MGYDYCVARSRWQRQENVKKKKREKFYFDRRCHRYLFTLSVAFSSDCSPRSHLFIAVRK
jgi:hypothetical protein